MSDGQLNADVEQYLQAAAMNIPPPQIFSDPLVSEVTPVEQLLRVLGLAANLGDPQDNAASAEQHAERDAQTLEAAEKFAAQEDAATAELSGITGEPSTAVEATATRPDLAAALAQQLPQIAAGIGGALAGSVGGILQPLAQIPQQAAQGLQQAMQTGMGLIQQAGGTASSVDEAALTDAPLTDDYGTATADLGAGVDGAGGGLGGADFGGTRGGSLGNQGGTAPTAFLGPPAVPSASTTPSSAPMTPIISPGAAPATTSGVAGMAGMPMVPPGAMAGPASTDKEVKADTKRVSTAPVRNGAPVQGRLTVPPALPAVTKIEAKPVVTRRIIAPGADQSADGKFES